MSKSPFSLPNLPKLRFKGFGDKWEEKNLSEITKNLNNKRIPLSSDERTNRKGIYPYFGATGQIDSINDWKINEEIIMLAEDCGNYKNFKTKPIAYYYSGKCWVNNHTHILSCDGHNNLKCIFYSLIHRNLSKYLNGENRPKLTLESLKQIKLYTPSSLLEQQKIAKFFSLLDKQIELWETKLKLNEQFIKIFINSLKLNNRIKFSNICEIFKNINGKSIEQYFSVSDGQDLNCYKVISIGNYSEDFKYVDDKCRIDKKYRSSFTPQICIKNDLCLVLNDKTSKCNILGKCILVDSDDSYVINQRSMILRNENNDFYFFYFQSYFFRNQIKKMAQIGNQSYINSSQLLNIKIPDINLELTKMFIYKNKTISILKEKMILKISLLIKRKQYFINKIFI